LIMLNLLIIPGELVNVLIPYAHPW
jgi:hypothetical protein